jgi:hypothetical protein
MAYTHKLWTLTALAAACLQAQALEFKTDDGLQGKLNGVISFGTQLRANDPSPDAYSSVVSPSVPGITKGNLAGQNGGSDLNFYKGDQISTVLKGVVDLDLRKDNIGLFVRGSAWKDFALGDNTVAYGNFPNGFKPNTPLSDHGFDPSSQFSNAQIRDYYIYGSTSLSEGKTLDARLGRQVLNWGGSQLIGGGIGSTINPTDFSSALRPGAQPFEGKLPLGMLHARLAAGAAWNLEGFMAYEHRGNVYPGCGTYFDVASFIAGGCNMISFAGASEQTRLATNNYVHRNADIQPSGSKHFGLAYAFKSEALNSDVKLYALNTTSVAPSYRMTVNSTTVSTADTNYGLIYPENVRVFGASFNKKLNAETTTYGEMAYRPNQSISFNASDLLGAFYGRSPASLLALRKGITSIPVGGTFDAYDRFGVLTGSLGTSKVFPKALNAERVVVTGEVGFSHINGLPGTDTLRFGRGTAYGAAAYLNASGALTACAETLGGKQCTGDGYTSSNAWGLRLMVAATYPNALAGATLTPSLFVAKDIKGYSYDGTFSEGRTMVRPGLRAEWDRKYFADVQYNRYSGGNYNLMVDRSYLSIVGGLRF